MSPNLTGYFANSIIEQTSQPANDRLTYCESGSSQFSAVWLTAALSQYTQYTQPALPKLLISQKVFILIF
ncbi:MAG TPA: hypothetical protein DDW52_21695 [Planctomycetaceae bacterium]|nr:hypothetical protein [Planctomycetaceae bacterium]